MLVSGSFKEIWLPKEIDSDPKPVPLWCANCVRIDVLFNSFSVTKKLLLGYRLGFVLLNLPYEARLHDVTRDLEAIVEFLQESIPVWHFMNVIQVPKIDWVLDSLKV